MQVDKKAKTLWIKADISFKNYQDYLNSKTDRFKLNLIDLLYVSNFKGGNATIHESSETVEYKLNSYSSAIQDIYFVYNNTPLRNLDIDSLERLISSVTLICALTNKKTKTKIDGFSVSYLSALLNAYFPDLIPIIDKRLLINSYLVQESDLDRNKQVKNIGSFYGSLIRNIYAKSCDTGKCIRDIDQELFMIKLKKE